MKKNEINDEVKRKSKKEEQERERRYHLILVTCLVSLLFAVFFGFGYAVGGVKTNDEVMKDVSKRQAELSTNTWVEDVEEYESDVDENKLLSNEEALSLGNNLWQYAYETFWDGKCSISRDEIRNHFANNVLISASSPIYSYTLEEFIHDGDYNCSDGGGRGGNQFYKTTTLSITNIDKDVVKFNAKSEYCDNSFCQASNATATTVDKDFIIKKVNGNWLIQSYYLPN